MSEPRKASTYRAARRNATLRRGRGLGLIWRGAKPRGVVRRGHVRLNRSRKWKSAETYAEARQQRKIG